MVSKPQRGDVSLADDVVQILFCTNRGYFQHMAVAALSIAESTRALVRIHVMAGEFDAALVARLRETLQPHPHVTVELHRVEDARLSELFTDKYLTKEAYMRFLAGDVLPAAVRRVIYLDCDLVVLADIVTLWRTNLNGRPLAAAPDLDWWGGRLEERLVDLGMRPDHRYFNSGVLVMDLDLWRRERIAEQLIDFARQRRSLLTYHDQDALNALLQNRVVLLPRLWNVQTLWYTRFVRETFPQEFRATAKARRDPAILHFSTAEKPWRFRVWTRKKAIYFRFLERTAWRHERPPDLTPTQRLEYDLSRCLLRAGLDIYVAKGAWRRLSQNGAPRLRALLDQARSFARLPTRP